MRFCAGTSKSEAAARKAFQSCARFIAKTACGGGARRQRRPLQRDPVVALGLAGCRGVVLRDGGEVRPDVGDERAAARGAHRDRDRIAAGHLDGLLAERERHGGAVEFVGVAVEALDVEVGDVGAEVREPPGDALVVADDHAREPRERVAR